MVPPSLDPFSPPQTNLDEPKLDDDLPVGFEFRIAKVKRVIFFLAGLYGFTTVLGMIGADTVTVVGFAISGIFLTGLHLGLAFLAPRAPFAMMTTAALIFFGLFGTSVIMDPAAAFSSILGLGINVLSVVVIVGGLREAIALRRELRASFTDRSASVAER